jgi:hypothetical protein
VYTISVSFRGSFPRGRYPCPGSSTGPINSRRLPSMSLTNAMRRPRKGSCARCERIRRGLDLNRRTCTPVRPPPSPARRTRHGPFQTRATLLFLAEASTTSSTEQGSVSATSGTGVAWPSGAFTPWALNARAMLRLVVAAAARTRGSPAVPPLRSARHGRRSRPPGSASPPGGGRRCGPAG